MQPSLATSAESEPVAANHATLDEVVGVREQTPLQKLFRAQSFWVAVALLALMLVMSWVEPTFGSAENLGNISRNFAPFGIMALGMTVVAEGRHADLLAGDDDYRRVVARALDEEEVVR